MAKNEIYYTLEIIPENVILIKFMNNLIISKNHISAIFQLIYNQLDEYPLVFDITNIYGFESEALEFCKQEEIYMYKKKIAIMYDNDTISEKYATLIMELSSGCDQINKFSVLKEAHDWAIH